MFERSHSHTGDYSMANQFGKDYKKVKDISEPFTGKQRCLELPVLSLGISASSFRVGSLEAFGFSDFVDAELYAPATC